MGSACSGKVEHLGPLKKSILNTLVPENEWDSFVALLKVEKYSISKHLYLNKKDSLYVVLSGEVTATIHCINKHGQPETSLLVRTYRPGEIIHMFSNSVRAPEGYLLYKDIRMTFSPVSVDGYVAVAVLEEEPLLKFLERPRADPSIMESFNWFCRMKLSDVMFDNKWTHGIGHSHVSLLQAHYHVDSYS
jgi:hypothetical protein